MWFKNKSTGHVWEILDEQLQQELLNKPHFEQVESPVESESSNSNKCGTCEKEFKTPKALKAHVRMMHKDKDGDK